MPALANQGLAAGPRSAAHRPGRRDPRLSWRGSTGARGRAA